MKDQATQFVSKLNSILHITISVDIAKGGTGLVTDKYKLLPGDLRLWDSEIANLINDSSGDYYLDPNISTLFISECVLIYLPPETSEHILSWTSNYFQKGSGNCCWLTYEQILPNDSFGEMMISNLKQRSIDLKGFLKWPTIEDQIARYRTDNLFAKANAIDIWEIWSSINPATKQW